MVPAGVFLTRSYSSRRCVTTQADLEAQFNLLMETRDELSRVYDAVNQIQDVRGQLSGLSPSTGRWKRRGALATATPTT